VEQILRSQEQGAKIISFCSTKCMCDMLACNLGWEFDAAAIHGDKSPGEWDFVFFSFGQGRLLFLLPLMWLHEGLTLKPSG
jgi:ATP-dependent RNA helicase DDX5/DBP2